MTAIPERAPSTGTSARDNAGPNKLQADEIYAMPTMNVLKSGLSPAAKVVYCFCDARQGTKGNPAKGREECAAECDLSPVTFDRAIKELALAGLVEPRKRYSDSGKASKMTEYPVLYSPKRKRETTIELPVNTHLGDDGKKRKAPGTYRRLASNIEVDSPTETEGLKLQKLKVKGSQPGPVSDGGLDNLDKVKISTTAGQRFHGDSSGQPAPLTREQKLATIRAQSADVIAEGLRVVVSR
jgi:hypothetical protein